MEEFLIPMIKAGAGNVTQQATIERVRFLTPDLAIVDGSWTITGARDAAGKELPPIRGRESRSHRGRTGDGALSPRGRW